MPERFKIYGEPRPRFGRAVTFQTKKWGWGGGGWGRRFFKENNMVGADIFRGKMDLKTFCIDFYWGPILKKKWGAKTIFPWKKGGEDFSVK